MNIISIDKPIGLPQSIDRHTYLQWLEEEEEEEQVAKAVVEATTNPEVVVHLEPPRRKVCVQL